jgi:hypothetical protein
MEVTTTPSKTRHVPVMSVTALDGSGLLPALITEPVMYWLIAPPGWITIWTLQAKNQELVLSPVRQGPLARITVAPFPGPVAPAVDAAAPTHAAAEQQMAANSVSRLRMSVSSQQGGRAHPVGLS